MVYGMWDILLAVQGSYVTRPKSYMTYWEYTRVHYMVCGASSRVHLVLTWGFRVTSTSQV